MLASKVAQLLESVLDESKDASSDSVFERPSGLPSLIFLHRKAPLPIAAPHRYSVLPKTLFRRSLHRYSTDRPVCQLAQVWWLARPICWLVRVCQLAGQSPASLPHYVV